MSWLLRAALVVVAVTAASAARADEGETDAGLDARRFEVAGFPIIGGNSDIGFQFGGASTFTRFYDDAHPYLWNVDLLLSASVKDDSNGFRLVQQSHVLRLDAPDLLNGLLRTDVRASLLRTINAGYFGLGNASVVDVAPTAPGAARRYQYLQEEARVRTIARVHTGTILDVALGENIRGEDPGVYAGSKLADDVTGGAHVVGTQSGLLAGLSAGIMLDTRDSEFVTRSGIFYQLGLAGTAGTAEGIGYGEASAVLSHYAPLGRALVFASRIIGSFQFGRVPFYDLEQGGVFEPQALLGSESGVRGVPEGRYAGPIKMIANTELRATPFPRFTLLGQHLRIGTTTFFDAGRVWAQYAASSPADGTKLGLKFGVGGGVFLQWGEAAIFRVEVAYSPDAASENPGFPVGIYVADGLMF